MFHLSNAIWIVNIHKELMEDVHIFTSFIAYCVGNARKSIDGTYILLISQN